GTMGKNAEPGAGAIYRYYRGELRQLLSGVTISNSICFAPDGHMAYFCDTIAKQIMAIDLDANGWPVGAVRTVVDLRDTGECPDGSVVDATGNIWNAQWGASRVACYSPDGQFVTAVDVPAVHVTCPAFAGATGQMFVTSATEGLQGDDLNPATGNGQTFTVTVNAIGQREHQVRL
ncbi:MAG: SMP-30/gluconolactonase/LRE family protein, partial [Pseudomonadota bacterium]